MSIERLPTEILLMIFRFIDDFRERGRLERVCKLWQKVVLDHGWKHARKIAPLQNARWLEPIGDRCGAHLVECCFYKMEIDSTLIRLIAEHFPALKHLDFRYCKMKVLDVNALGSLQEVGVHLRSLNFFKTRNHHLLPHFPYHLQHFGLHLSRQHNNFDPLPSRFFADLRSLYFFTEFSMVLEQMLEKVQKDFPRLMALYLDTTFGGCYPVQSQRLLSRISNLKNLRFLRIVLDYSVDPQLICSCLNNLPQLIALQLNLLDFQQRISDVFRSQSFRGLVHLSLYLDVKSDNFDSIGLLSTAAPKLRSLNLNIIKYSMDQSREIGCQMLKIAQNGILEVRNKTGLYFDFASQSFEQYFQ